MQSIVPGCYKKKSVTKSFIFVEPELVLEFADRREKECSYLVGSSGDLEHEYGLSSVHFYDPHISQFKSKQIRHI